MDFTHFSSRFFITIRIEKACFQGKLSREAKRKGFLCSEYRSRQNTRNTYVIKLVISMGEPDLVVGVVGRKFDGHHVPLRQLVHFGREPFLLQRGVHEALELSGKHPAAPPVPLQAHLPPGHAVDFDQCVQRGLQVGGAVFCFRNRRKVFENPALDLF
jgi:hypothetical protein